MTIIVQQPKDSNGNPQPMVYDSDTKKVIVDHDGYVLNGGQKLVNVPTLLGYVNTPKTTSDGYGEALQYAIDNPINPTNSEGIGYWLPEVKLMSGYYTVSKPIVLNVPYRIMNLTLKGVDSADPFISCAFSSTSGDEYPYAININSNDLTNIRYTNIQWEHFVVAVPSVPSGFSPYGFANFDFSSVNTGQNVFVGYDLNVANSGWAGPPFNLIGFQQIHMYDFETYGGASVMDAGYCEFLGGYSDSTILIGGISNGTYFSNMHGRVRPGGNISRWFLLNSPIVFGVNGASATFTIEQIIAFNATASNHPNLIFNDYTGGTVTINQLTIYGASPIGNTSNYAFSATNGSSLVINEYYLYGIVPNPQGHYWVSIPANTTNPQLSTSTSGTTAGTAVQVQTNFESLYKRVVFTFDGYENDTTTNQVIDFINAFSTVASITANSTGLTISTTTSGITITAPDSTTTYSGILIIEGY